MGVRVHPRGSSGRRGNKRSEVNSGEARAWTEVAGGAWSPGGGWLVNFAGRLGRRRRRVGNLAGRRSDTDRTRGTRCVDRPIGI